jgi:membrane associated rhomboid family serine protease
MIFFYPVGHEKGVRRIPYVTFGLIVANCLIWLLTLRILNANPDPFLQRFGFIPAEPNLFSVFTSMFLHAGLFHILGNMWFLYLVGCNMEDVWGRLPFLGFYLVAGVAAALTHMAMNSASVIPCVGASGAISGVMGAFMIRHLRTKVTVRWAILFIPFFRTGTFRAEAYIVFGWWFADQLLVALMGAYANVAVWAHIGGFLFGLAAALVNKQMHIEETYLAPRLEQATELADQDPRVLEAMEAHSSGDSQRSLELLCKVIETTPGNVDARLEAARRQLDLGRTDDAVENLDHAIRELIRIGDEKTALAIFYELCNSKLERKLGPNALFRLANLLAEGEQFAEAARLFGLIPANHASDPLAPIALYRCASILKDKFHDHDLATGAYRYLLERYPDTEWRPAVEDALSQLAEERPLAAAAGSR